MSERQALPALAVENVSHAYGPRRVLEGVSFTVPQGSFTVLLGLNGAGKSTLFALITRLYDTRAGRIVVLGHDIGRERVRPCAGWASFSSRAPWTSTCR